MPKINPEILIWARKTAGLSVAEAAKKLALSSPERLEALEKGDREPSRRQLANMAAKYRRPLLTFYLTKPPRQAPHGQDFRTFHAAQGEGSKALLDALLRDVQARQQLVRAALEETEENIPLGFVGSARMNSGVDAVTSSMRNVLGITLQDFRAQRTVTEAFASLRAASEQAGVFVLLIGNLGTHHTDIEARDFRGFSLADNIAPFIVINEKDSRAAWSFTLLHELTHIWLGQTAISGYDSDAAVERFCDAVAANFLLAPGELDLIGAGHAASLPDLKARIEAFAVERNLSRKMVAYNLMRSNAITRDVFLKLSDALDAERVVQKEADKKTGGPDYYVVRRHRVGPGLIGLVQRMVASGALSTTKAGKVLGVKATSVDRLFGNHRTTYREVS